MNKYRKQNKEQDEESGGFNHEDEPMSQNTSTQGSTKNKFKGSDAQNILPVTIRQIMNAVHDQNDQFKIGRLDVNVVTFVAKVISQDTKPQKIVFIVDDGTGMMDVNLWVDQNTDNHLSAQKDDAKPGTYVRIYGHLRQWNAKNSVLSLRIKPVTDFNEITYHNLEVIYAHLYGEKGLLPQEQTRSESNSSSQSYSNDNKQIQNSQSSAVVRDEPVDYGNEESYTNDAPAPNSEISAVVRRTIKQLSSKSQHGVKVDNVITQIGNNYSQAEIRHAIQELLDEGVVYNTITEEYLKCH